jgi:hypothetical protein
LVSEMNNRHVTEVGKAYLVYGSGLMAVPYGRLNEIPKMKTEFHASEVSWAMMAARTRKLA